MAAADKCDKRPLTCDGGDDTCDGGAAGDDGAKRARLDAPEEPAQKAAVAPAVSTTGERSRKRFKFAMLLSYCGRDYLGMQINKEERTIERDLMTALRRCDLIDDDDAAKPSAFYFQRAARTDKGVSAVRQVCSMMLPRRPDQLLGLVDALNARLPPAIRVMELKRSTKGFNSKTWCDARSYSYTTPTFAFAPAAVRRQPSAPSSRPIQQCDESFRLCAERLAELNDILALFRGTHHFFNFTAGKVHGDASCDRYITVCRAGEPFEHDGIQYTTVLLKGQSFLLHQIRKIIGITITIMRGHEPKSIVQKAWLAERLDIPIAPGLGLVLEQPHYGAYDTRFKQTHEPLDTWNDSQEAVAEFKRTSILGHIFQTERHQKSMLAWLETLQMHSFASPPADGGEAVEQQSASVSADSRVVGE